MFVQGESGVNVEKKSAVEPRNGLKIVICRRLMSVPMPAQDEQLLRSE